MKRQIVVPLAPANPEYYEFMRQLRNDPRVQDGFLERVCITAQDQVAYMAKHAGHYIIALVKNEPAGYAGSINGDIRICTHPDFQGLGIGRVLLNGIMDRFPSSQARIKPGNHASEALFLACGFKQVGESDGLLIFRRADLAAD
jgi:GNAT superfamily N-acetyltransferase